MGQGEGVSLLVFRGFDLQPGGKGTYHRARMSDSKHFAAPLRRRRTSAPCGSPLPIVLVLMVVTRAAAVQDEYVLDETGELRKQEVLDPATPEGQMQQVRRVLAEDSGKAAWALADQWITNHPNHPLLPQAYLVRADAHVAQQEYFKSLFDYEYVIRVFPESPQFNTALEREFEIARLFAAGMRRKWLGLRFFATAGEAEELFIRIQERSPGSDVAEKASLALGDFYFDRSQMLSAAEVYILFLTNYPDSRHREKAVLRLIQSHLATFKGSKFDATGLIEAAQWLKVFDREFPVSAERLGVEALRLRIEESLAVKTFYQARWYERVSKEVSAIYLHRNLLREYPHTVAGKAALRRLSQLGEVVKRLPRSQPPEPSKSSAPPPEAGEVPAAAEGDLSPEEQ